MKEKMEKLGIRIKEIQEIKIKLEMKDKMENLKKWEVEGESLGGLGCELWWDGKRKMKRTAWRLGVIKESSCTCTC